MPTDKQREAGRLKRAPSQGSRTSEGNAVSSLDALRHGCTAHMSILLPYECQGSHRDWKTSRPEVLHLLGLGPSSRTRRKIAERTRRGPNLCRINVSTYRPDAPHPRVRRRSPLPTRPQSGSRPAPRPTPKTWPCLNSRLKISLGSCGCCHA